MTVRVMKASELAAVQSPKLHSMKVSAVSKTMREGSHEDIARSAAVEALRGMAGEIAVDEVDGKIRRLGTFSEDVLLGVRGNVLMFERSHATYRATGDVLTQLKSAVGSSVRFAADPSDGTILLVDSIKVAPAVVAISKRPLFPTIAALQQSRPEPKPAFPSVQRLKELHKILGMQPHIPFAFPKNGCWARAEAMCQMLIGFLGINQRLVSKIWISCSTGSAPCLEVKTAVNPDCKVNWFWHVAPLVEGESSYFVMDPALSDRPITRAAWRSLMSVTDATAMFQYSTWERWGFLNKYDIDAEPKSAELKEDLAKYRNDLSIQILTNGPIPYAKCALP